MDNEKITVLLIEDNPGDARLIQEYLSESGSDIFRLERVDRLSLGLERFARGDIGVILLDLTLPDSQRLEGLTKVLAKAPHVPVVVLSGVKDEKVAIEAVHAGAQDYLVKGSIDANLLVRLLRHAIERHRLRVALRESESRYRLLAENIADVVWVADEKGWITYVSPSVEPLLGYTVEEVERLRIRDILTVDSADQARRLIRNQMEVGVQQSRSSPLSLTLEHVRKDGSTVWAEVMLSFLLDKKGNFAGIMGSTRDVTARKIAEEALQRSEEHFRALIENASDAVLVMNEDLTVRYESPAVERMLGYRVEERIGRSGLEHAHPDDIRDTNITNKVDRFLKEPGAIIQAEVRIRHKNGSWRNIEVTGRNLLNNAMIRGVVVNFRDVTERRKAEEARRESEARFRTVFEGTSMAIALVDRRGKPLGVNPAFSQMFGYSFEEFCGINNMKYLYPDDAMADTGLYMEMLNGKRDHYTIEKRYIRKSGEVLWGRQNLSTVRDAEGKPEYFIAMIEDITERKRMEEEIIRLSDAVKMSRDSIAITDLEGIIIEANDAALKMHGLDNRADLIGREALELIAPEDHEMLTNKLGNTLVTGSVSSVPYIEYHSLRKDGSKFLVEATISVIKNGKGESTGYMAVIRDISERKKLEEELIRLSDAVKMATESIIITDMEGIVVDVNEATLKLQGAKCKNDLVGLKPFDTIAIADQEKAFADLAKVMEKGYVNEVQYHVTTRDGRIILVETSASLMRDRNGVPLGVVAVTKDITERKRMEEALKQSEEQFRALVENALDAIVVINGEGVVTYASPSNERMLGYPIEQTIGMDGFGFAHPEDMPRAVAAFTSLIEEPGTPVSIELRVRHRDGSWLTVEAIAKNMVEDEAVKGIVVNWRDITERKKAEEALRESEERLRLYFESVSDVIYSLDKDFRFVSISPSVERILGYQPEEFMGKRFDKMNLLVPETVRQAFVDVTRVLGGERIVTYGKFVRKNGGIIHGEVSLTPVFAADGSITGVLGVARDVTERKVAEKALRDSEEKHRLYFESVSDVIYSIDREMRVTSVSPSVEKVLGYKPEELIGKIFPEMDILAPESMECAIPVAMGVLHGERATSEWVFITKDGARKYGEVISTPLFGPDGEVIGALGVGRDVTERKIMEQTLLQREQDYLILLESTQEGMFVVDAETLKVIYGNRRASMMFGFDPELQAGIGANILDMLHPEDREIAIKGFLEDLPKLERRKRYEVRALTKDGREILISALATRIEFRGRLAVLLSAKDITEQRKAEEALRQSEHDYKVLFESTLDGLIVLDAETMKIVLANQTAAKVAGVSSADNLAGLDPFEFIPAENRDAVRNIVREDVFEKDLHRIHEYRVFTAEGKEAWVSAVSTRTEYRGKKAALISVRDITERKKAEGEKQKMEEQLRLAGRLAAVGELAAGVAHELNNPIAAVQGYAQLLSAKKDIDESVKKDLNIIYREAQRAGKITKNLLSFARRHEPEKRFISINEAIEKTLELSAHQMKIHNIELEVELDQNLPGTMADFHQMQQVFVNIINNAEQAMLESHGKGKLIVKTSRSGDMIQIVLTDDGPGIPEENLKRIFDPFFTTKGVGKGTGLGLSICYGLVEAHNGRIYARSKPGEGATFVVEIPIIPDERPAEAAFIKTKKGSAIWRK